jgi:hypothetical protein
MVNAGNPMRLQHMLVSMPMAAAIVPPGRHGLQLGAPARQLPARQLIAFAA